MFPNIILTLIYFNMKSQHQFRTNQLGITYNQYGENLHKQLQLNYQKLKLNGKEFKSASASIKRQPRGNHQNVTRI
jgi:hypothetical protein